MRDDFVHVGLVDVRHVRDVRKVYDGTASLVVVPAFQFLAQEHGGTRSSVLHVGAGCDDLDLLAGALLPLRHAVTQRLLALGLLVGLLNRNSLLDCPESSCNNLLAAAASAAAVIVKRVKLVSVNERDMLAVINDKLCICLAGVAIF